MRSVSRRLADLCENTKINLGRVGDNLHTQVRIDCLKLFEEYPSATAALTVRPPKGDSYPAVIVRDGDFVIWNVTDSDLIYPGTGEAQLVFTEGDVVAHKAPFKTFVERSIQPSGQIPTPIQNWVEQANEVLEAVEDAIPEGGTTGQVLAKASDEDYDLEWVDQSGGGGGTSDYEELDNLPQIGGVTLKGNKTLHDLGAAAEGDIPDVSGFYTKPSGGIPDTDLASGVQTSLGKADTAYQKPSGGIPAEDMASGVIPVLTDLIDDTAGDGDTNKVWSADKTADVTGSLLSQINSVHQVPSGGSSGQVLGKASGTDYDVEWKTVSGSGVVDSSMSTSSENPVQNKVITLAINGLSDDLADANIELVQDKYIKYADGGISNYTGLKYVQFHVYKGMKVVYKYTISTPDARGLCFYGKDGSMVSSAQTISTAQVLYVPANAVLCRATVSSIEDIFVSVVNEGAYNIYNDLDTGLNSKIIDTVFQYVGNKQIPITDKKKYIDLSGSTVDLSNPSTNNSFMYSVIDCAPGDEFTISARGDNGIYAWGFINSNNEVLSKSDNNANLSGLVLVAPANASKLIINNWVASRISYYGRIAKNNLLIINNDLSTLEESTTFTDNGYIKHADGSVGSITGYFKYSNYIPVSKDDKIVLQNLFSDYLVSQNNVGYAFYDKNKTFINGSGGHPGSTKALAITAPTNAAYFRFTATTDVSILSKSSICINRAGTIEELKNTVASFVENAPAYTYDTPLEHIDSATAFLPIFHHVGCIGDSLASGESAYKEDGTRKYVDLYDFSWGQCLARETGNTYYNFSQGGLTAKQWVQEQSATAFDGNHKCEMYIIGLGQNDKNNSVTIGTSSDINLSDYTQNADTFYGNYGKIIQMIKEHQPKAKIFVITDPLDSVETYGINDAVRAMATIFDDVYVLDFNTYKGNYFSSGFLYQQYRSSHFNAVGYKFIAMMIGSYIDWYIYHNPSEFLQVEFIGTNYEWTD